MVRIALLLVCLFIWLPASGLHADTIYTWRDQKGNLHITDTPPPAKARVVETVQYLAIPKQHASRKHVSDGIQEEQSEDAARENAEIRTAKARALEARAKADEALRKQNELLGRLGRNKKMRKRNRYKLRKAAEYAESMEKLAQEAEGQLAELEQRLAKDGFQQE